ncbi:hypothetical protein EMIT0111MI5_130147 [Burkholderia sp. IT-111MI5]
MSAFSDAASVSVRLADAHAIDSAAGGSPLASVASRARSASTCAATASAPRTLIPKPITTAVASAVVQTVSIRIPASLPTMRGVPSSAAASSRSFGHLSATRMRASSGSVASPSASATPIAMLRPPSASTARGTMQPTEQSSALPGCANHGRPCRPRPAVCSNATRTSGAGSAFALRGSALSRVATSALVEPVAATMSSGHARGAASRCASSRLRAMCASPESGVSEEVGAFMVAIVATGGGRRVGKRGTGKYRYGRAAQVQSLGISRDRINIDTKIWHNDSLILPSQRNRIEIEFIPAGSRGGCENTCGATMHRQKYRRRRPRIRRGRLFAGSASRTRKRLQSVSCLTTGLLPLSSAEPGTVAHRRQPAS